MEGAIINLVIWLAFGVACAMIAHSRGRSAVGWFFVGLFASCIGLILVLALPNLKVEEARRRRMETENRRLKEKVAKDRIVSDRRHVETNRRLKVHDVAIGVDTETRLPESEQVAPPELPERADPPAATRFDDTEWYYADGSQQSPSVSFGALRRLWQKGHLAPETLVWTEGMDEWLAVRDVADLREALDA